MSKFAALLPLFFFSFLLGAQPYRIAADITINRGDGIIRTVDKSLFGDLLAVGEHLTPTGDTDGLLLRYGASEKFVPITVSQEYDGEDGLYDMATSPLGDLWLVGYRTDLAADRYVGRLQLLDVKHEIALNRILPTGQRDEVFTHVVRFANGELLIVGKQYDRNRQNLRDQRLTLYAYRQNKLERLPLDNLLSAACETVELLISSDRTSAVLIANGYRSNRRRREGVVWAFQISQQFENEALGSTPVDQLNFCRSATQSPREEILLCGATWRNSESEPWSARLTYGDAKIIDYAYRGSGKTESLIAAQILPSRQINYIRQTTVRRYPAEWEYKTFSEANFDQFSADSPPELEDLDEKLPNDTRVHVEDFYLDRSQNLWLAGTYEQPRGGRRPKLYRLEPKSYYSSTVKGKLNADVTCENARLDFEDGNADNQLSPGERAAIAFDLVNHTSQDFSGLQVVVTPTTASTQGIQLVRPILPIDPLGAGKRLPVSIPVTTQKEILRGTTTFLIQVQSGGQAIAETQVTIRSGSGTGDRGTVIFSQQYPEISSGTRSADGREQVIRFRIIADQPLSQAQTEVVRNRSILQGGHRGTKVRMSTGQLSNQKYVHEFEAVIPLDEGLNEVQIRVVVDGKLYTSEIIPLHFQPQLPRLHFVGLAPDYRGFDSIRDYDRLRFNGQDIRDVTDAIQAQGDGNHYQSVFIDTLLSYERTTKDAIESFFYELEGRATNKSAPDYIAPGDVVMVYLSGHADLFRNRYMILPADFDPDRDYPSSVNYDSGILDFLRGLDRKVIVMIDACHSGAAGGKGGASVAQDSLLSVELIKLHSASPGIIAIQSSSEKESSYEDEAWRNGAFTEAFLEAIYGRTTQDIDGNPLRADASFYGEGNGLLTITELATYIGNRVPALMREAGRPESQHPRTARQVDSDDLDPGLSILRVLQTEE